MKAAGNEVPLRIRSQSCWCLTHCAITERWVRRLRHVRPWRVQPEGQGSDKVWN